MQCESIMGHCRGWQGTKQGMKILRIWAHGTDLSALIIDKPLIRLDKPLTASMLT